RIHRGAQRLGAGGGRRGRAREIAPDGGAEPILPAATPEGGARRESQAEQDEERRTLQLHGDLLKRGLGEGELRICEQEAPRIAAPLWFVKYDQTLHRGPEFF